MSVSIYKIVFAFLLVNICLIIYSGFIIFNDKSIEPTINNNLNSFENLANLRNGIFVEIWSKAAIGQYVWENILRGNIDQQFNDNLYIEGSTRIANVTFKFRSGPSLKIQSLHSFPVENIILILNWRNGEKINYSVPWIEAIESNNDVKNVGIIALGHEQCNNKWILSFLNRSNKIKFIFVVYDWNKVDNQLVFQWPLGVATYRNFPSNHLLNLDFNTDRPYICNFIATIYPNSSRQDLSDLFYTNPQFREKCIVKTRSNWESKETSQSMEYYVQALKLSELTLSPIGMNHECYRILEAVEYGSIPVIEIDLRHVRKGSCDRNNTLRIYKQLNAPFIYVHNWTIELPGILQKQTDKSESDKRNERIQLIKWYHKFKIIIRKTLVDTINAKFI